MSKLLNLLGTKPNQIPTNSDLGRLAFQDFISTTDDTTTTTACYPLFTDPVNGTAVKTSSTLLQYIPTTGRLGLGVTPASGYKLHIAGGGNAGIGIQSTSSGNTWLDFLNTAGTVQGNIFYDHANNYMSFGTSASGTRYERMRVTTAGNILIAGTTDDIVSKLQVSGGINATSIGITNVSPTTGLGISLYSGPATGSMATFGLAFAGCGTYGTHGAVTSDWATYFTIDTTAGRGWIFKNTNTGTGGNVVSISNTGVITATSYATSSGSLVVDWKNLTAQYALQGGGTVTTTTIYILWSARVIAIPVEASEESASGFFDISCPTSGTVVYYNGSNVTTAQTCTANGIPLLGWEALYYQITEGQSSAYDQTKFRIVNYQNSTWVPGPGWICIAARNGDDNSFKWLPGQVNIPQSQYYVSSTGAKSWIAGASTTTTGTGAVVLSATPTLTGNMKIDSVQSSGVGVIGQYDAVYGSASTWYNAGFRNDGASVYLLSSDVQTTQALAKAAAWNGYRPLSWNLSTGKLYLCATGQVINVAGADGLSQLNIASANNYGGTGYAGVLSFRNLTAGATNIDKHIRLNNTGGLEVVNSAYNAVIFGFSDGGVFTALSIIGGTSLRESKVAVSASAIDLATGSYFSKTISGATTFTLSNVPASGTAVTFLLDLTNGGAATVTWWSGIKWASGTVPTLTAAGRDVLVFFTHDGGTTWTGVITKDVK